MKNPKMGRFMLFSQQNKAMNVRRIKSFIFINKRHTHPHTHRSTPPRLFIFTNHICFYQERQSITVLRWILYNVRLYRSRFDRSVLFLNSQLVFRARLCTWAKWSKQSPTVMRANTKIKHRLTWAGVEPTI